MCSDASVKVFNIIVFIELRLINDCNIKLVIETIISKLCNTDTDTQTLIRLIPTRHF